MHPTPVLLHARDPRRGELIVASNAAALERGVRLGMPLAEAAALAQRGGDCRIETHDPAADLAALAQLAEHCERFSPLVGWRTVAGGEGSGTQGVPGVQGSGQETGDREQETADTLFLDVTGIGVLFGGEEALAREVIAEMQRLGYQARVAIAGTIGAAWAEAKDEGRRTKDETGRKDSGFVLCPSSLDLSSLRLPPKTLDLLSQLGVTQLEQLLALPRESLRARFGERLLLRIDQFFGAAQETIVAHRPPPRFMAERVLEYSAERRDAIEQLVQELVQRIAQDLAARREGVVQLTCRLDCAPGQPLRLEIGLFRPSAEPEHLWDLVRMQLEQATIPGPVGRITLAAALTAPLENRQGELFAGGEHEAERQLALFIDRCSSRLGADAVLRAELTADPLPERAAKLVRSAECGMRSRSKAQGPRSKVRRRRSNLGSQSAIRNPQSALHRPLFLLTPPLPLGVLSVAPDGPPHSFDLGGHRHLIADKQGPERIETGWWRGRSIRRDYWRVETATGQRFWLFRNLQDGKWHLHGAF